MKEIKKQIKNNKNYCGAMVIYDFCEECNSSHSCNIEQKPLKGILKQCKKAVNFRREVYKKWSN